MTSSKVRCIDLDKFVVSEISQGQDKRIVPNLAGLDDRFWRGRCSNLWVGKRGRVQSRVTFDGKVRNLGQCVLKFDCPLPEDHQAHIPSTADSPHHHCKLGGSSASISGISVYRGSKRGRRVAMLSRLAKLDCPTTGDRGAALTLVRLE
jgi:hypothetical protein